MEMNQLVLDTSVAASVNGDLIDCDRLQTLWLQFTLDCTDTTLAGTFVTFRGMLEPLQPGVVYPTLSATGVIVAATAALPTGFTYGGAGSLAIATPAAGRSDVLLKCVNPPRYVQPVLTYGSGGTGLRFRLRAFGSKVS